LRRSWFDYDTSAGLINRRTFAELPDGGRPDGLAVDAEGGVWTAVSNGGAVHRYSAEGVLEEKLAVPACKVTACTFGGDHLDQLLTTSPADRPWLAEAHWPGAIPSLCDRDYTFFGGSWSESG